MWLVLIQGIVLGFSAGISPGPLQAYFLGQSLQNGWRKTLPAAFAPLLSDGPIVAIVLLLLTLTGESVLAWLQLVGGFFIFYLGYGAYQTFRTPPDPDPGTPSGKQALRSTVLLNMLSPNPYIFWGTVLGPTVLSLWRSAPGQAVAYISGFYVTLVVVFMIFIVLFSSLRSGGLKVVSLLSGFSALALAIFGSYQIYSAVGRLL
jgi:threonine/homoserine/homoserine lactone efflux protein